MGDPGRVSTYGQLDGRSWTWQYLRTVRWANPDVAVFLYEMPMNKGRIFELNSEITMVANVVM